MTYGRKPSARFEASRKRAEAIGLVLKIGNGKKYELVTAHAMRVVGGLVSLANVETELEKLEKG